jgi:hypothetical protein
LQITVHKKLLFDTKITEKMTDSLCITDKYY